MTTNLTAREITPRRAALFTTGEPVWALAPGEVDSFAGVAPGADAGWVSLPLRSRGGVRGALHLSFRSPRELSDAERRWLQSVVSQCALALERSLLFDDEQRLRERSERLQEMTAALSNALTRFDVAQAVVRGLGEALGAEGTSLAVVVEERDILRTLAWQGLPDELFESGADIPLENLAVIADTRRPRFRTAFSVCAAAASADRSRQVPGLHARKSAWPGFLPSAATVSAHEGRRLSCRPARGRTD